MIQECYSLYLLDMNFSLLLNRDRRMDDVRGGFVLKAKSDEPPARRRSLSERSSNFKDSLLKVSLCYNILTT